MDVQLEFVFNKRSQPGELNGNWRHGRSAKHYYYTKRSREKHRDKHNARNKLYRALKSGKLIKQPCIFCGSIKSEFHHEDYNKPLMGHWLCRREHVFFDNLLRKGFCIKDFILLCMVILSRSTQNSSVIGLKDRSKNK